MLPNLWPIFTGRAQPSLAFDFGQSQGLVAGRGGQTITFTRAGGGATYFDSTGTLVTVGANTPRWDYDPLTLAFRGLLMESTRTNLLLWNQDLTNAAWVKTTMTPLKNITGIDGAANSASRITATAGSATCLQAVVSASADRATTAYIKRLTGTGTIEMTQDGGTLWTNITSSINSSTWSRILIPAALVTNPSVGWRITTNGDAIAVDYAQLESFTFPSSAIATTTVAVTRNVDTATIATLTPWYNQSEGTIVAEYDIAYGTTVANFPAAVTITDGTSNNRHVIRVLTASTESSGAVVDATVTQASMPIAGFTYGVMHKSALSYKLNDFAFVTDGGAVQTDGAGTVPTVSQLDIGQGPGSNALYGHIKRVSYYPRRLSNDQLRALTA